MQVGAEVGWAAVTAVAGDCPGTDLHHVRGPGLQTLDPRVASLGGHCVGDGFTLILQDKRREIMRRHKPRNTHLAT